MKVDNKWIIAEYFKGGYWRIRGWDNEISDRAFKEINETRLTSPAESQGENKQ